MKNHAMNDTLIVSNVSDDPFAIDLAHMCGQTEEIADLISLKIYANTEFCPRYISDEGNMDVIGRSLEGKTVVICSAATNDSRGSLAMRTLMLARGAKDNGAKKVILVEPDLFFSAQDRGPHRGEDEENRSVEDLKKFDGQPFTAKLYAELLKHAGVDAVITVHNHSSKVQKLFGRAFGGEFYNLIPNEVYADYLKYSDMVVTGKDGDNLVLCAPDMGALPFVNQVRESLSLSRASCLVMEKSRVGERQVRMAVGAKSDITLDQIAGKDVIILDDMVRTGSTVVECCRLLREANPHDREVDRALFAPAPGQERGPVRAQFLFGGHVLEKSALAPQHQSRPLIAGARARRFIFKRFAGARRKTAVRVVSTLLS
ncbi:MAG: prs [Fibrobacteria bacterium]|nr:prs [Fibrobacteria bacterium]